MMGENSVFKQAQKSKLEYNIAKAREQLEVALGQAKIFKHTDKKYNQDDYLDELMKKEISNIKIADDIVIVDGYAFEIDRNEPKIGQYIGEEKDLVFPEVTTNVTLATDSKTATIHITAKEEKNGISKIEIIQEGYVLETYECGNTKEEVIKDYIAKQNGIYIIKVYAGLTAREKATVDGLIASVKYSPNGNEEYKKEHQVKVSVAEDIEKVKSIKYQWLQTTAEPAESSFTTACANGETITGESYTGTYYLWTLIETESGKTNIGRSERFNFDNQGPVVTLESIPKSETSFTLNATAYDEQTQIVKYDFYVDDKLEKTIETNEEMSSFTVEGVSMGSKACYVIVKDEAGNETKQTVTASTKMHAWEKWNVVKTRVYAEQGTSSSRSHSGTSYVPTYDSYSFNSRTGTFTGTRTR